MTETDKQKACRYCHDPFLDFSGKTDYEVDLGDGVYCGTDDKGILEYGASFDSGCLGAGETVNINYCPMCGRKLSKVQQ
ncbi:hypothetical protein NMZ1139_08170 [Lactiplantibacillus plantarum]|uniref:hypothetical protein n=1 Tax=Lactiplantibacillus plantarum TaxID=1590 RepID=UPI001CFD4367|nr:hypothetical protein [Lactiplantibacillus plantarum]GJI52589.1 hypothetical protein NMZ1139_08170 [Lactiplantibacillus plantarum]